MARYELGDLVWKIDGDTRDFDKAYGKIDKGINKLGGLFKKLGGAIVAAFAVKKIADFSKRIVGLASDLAESQNAVNVVFKNASNQIAEFGRTSVDAVGLTTTEFNSLATVTGALLKQTGNSLDSVADSTIELTKRAADTASIFNVDVNEALTAYNALLRGETEPARRFGITISDAAVQAEALASGLVKTKDEITDQIKVQARYNLLMKQSADYAGDFQNTSLGFANQLKILRKRFQENSTTLGESLLPLANVGIVLFNDWLKSSSGLSDSIKDFVTSAEGAAQIASFLGSLAGTFAVVGEAGKIAFQAFGTAIENIVEPFQDLAVSAEGNGVAFNILGAIMQGVSGTMRVLSLTVQGGIENIINLGKAILSVKDIAAGFVGLLKGDISPGEYKDSINQSIDLFKQFGQGLVQNQVEVIGAIKDEVIGFSEGAEDAARRFQEAFNNAAGDIGQRVFVALRAASNNTKNTVEETNDAIEADTEDTTKNVFDSWKDFTNKLKEETAATVSTIGGQLGSVASSLGTIIDNNSTKSIQNLEKQIEAEEEGTDKRIELEKKLDKEKKKAAREQAKRTKAINLFQAGIDTASAIIEALPNYILAAAVGITGAAEAAAIASTPLPQLATGGIIPAGNPTAIAGEGSSSEMVMPLTDENLAKLGTAIAQATQRQNTTLNLQQNINGQRVNTTMDIDDLLRRSRRGEKVINMRGVEQ